MERRQKRKWVLLAGVLLAAVVSVAIVLLMSRPPDADDAVAEAERHGYTCTPFDTVPPRNFPAASHVASCQGSDPDRPVIIGRFAGSDERESFMLTRVASREANRDGECTPSPGVPPLLFVVGEDWTMSVFDETLAREMASALDAEVQPMSDPDC